MKVNYTKSEQNPTQELYRTVIKQDEILKNLIAQQRIIHTAVTNKNWENLDASICTLNKMSEEFRGLETIRTQLCLEICPEHPTDMYEVAQKLPLVFKKPFIEAYHEIRQRLTISKIENKAINDYISITQNFLQGVMENIIPQRRNKVYSRTGAIVKNEPDSVVLNTYM